jgi:hypothetical protein
MLPGGLISGSELVNRVVLDLEKQHILALDRHSAAVVAHFSTQSIELRLYNVFGGQ